MRTRIGKIARLPEGIRVELNRRLADGARGREVVAWLNALPEVSQVVAELFGGRPITEHNVSEWRLGGFQDWLRDQETRERVLRMTDEYKELELDGRMEQLMTAELLDATNQLQEMKDPDARWARLRRISRELCRLQNARCRGLQMQLRREKAERAVVKARLNPVARERSF